MLWTASAPCGFQWRQIGRMRKMFRDFDGVPLIYEPKEKLSNGNT